MAATAPRNGDALAYGTLTSTRTRRTASRRDAFLRVPAARDFELFRTNPPSVRLTALSLTCAARAHVPKPRGTAVAAHTAGWQATRDLQLP